MYSNVGYFLLFLQETESVLSGRPSVSLNACLFQQVLFFVMFIILIFLILTLVILVHV